MGEANKKSRSRAVILAAEPRCIYCSGPSESLEHMPPRSMFRSKSRPSGLEFATCKACNNGTRGADVVAAFFARMRREHDTDHWQIKEINNLKPSLERSAPGVAAELFREQKSRQVLNRTPGGILLPEIEVHADGPLLRAYMGIFASKLGMAIYREHIGTPLPLEGTVYSHWFLNAGLAESTAESMLRILPIGSSLQQGKFSVADQFAYRFNCDGSSIAAALARFHTGLYVFFIATSQPNFYLRNAPHLATSTTAKPGDLLGMIPSHGKRYWS